VGGDCRPVHIIIRKAITYFLKDGTSKTISANNTTVWWNNKIHVIKDKEMFVNLTEGIFFLEDLQTK